MTAETRGLIRACAAICEARGRTDLAVRLLDLIPPLCEFCTRDFAGVCMVCGDDMKDADG